LSGANSYTGGTYLTGTLTTIVGSNTAVGAGTLTLTTGTLLADAAGRTLANNVVLNGFGFIFGGSSYNGSASGSTASSSLTFTGTDPNVNYPTAAGPFPAVGFGNAPANPPGIPITLEAVIETGYVNIVTPGNYTFGMISDDGTVAYIDGILVVNNDQTSTAAL